MRYLDLIRKQPKEEQVPIRLAAENWYGAWKELAQLTSGIGKDDPRFFPVCDSLEVCDRAFEQDDWLRFQQGVDSLKAIMSRSP